MFAYGGNVAVVRLNTMDKSLGNVSHGAEYPIVSLSWVLNNGIWWRWYCCRHLCRSKI